MEQDNNQNTSVGTENSTATNLIEPADFSTTPVTPKPSFIKKHKLLIIGFIILILVIIIVIVIYYSLVILPNSKSNIFYRALEKSYSVTSFQKERPYGSSRDLLLTKVNVVVNNQPSIKSNFTATSNGNTVNIQSLANNQDISHYIIVTNTKDSETLSLSNKWYTVREAGQYDQHFSTTPMPLGGLSIKEQLNDVYFEKALFDPRMDLFGTHIVGNFSNEQRQELIDYIKNHKIYNFDEKKIKTTKLDGKEAYEFPVGVSTAELLNLNKMAASYFGINIGDLESRSRYLGRSSDAIFYIDKATEQVVKVVELKQYPDIVNKYSGFNEEMYINSSKIIKPESYATFGQKANKICRQTQIYQIDNQSAEASLCNTLSSIIGIY